MKTDPLRQFAQLRQELFSEKSRIEARLRELNQVLTDSPSPASLPPSQPAPPPRRRGGRPGRKRNQPSLREVIAQALSAKGPLSRSELGEAVKELGYTSRAKNPLASMGVFLYSKRSPFKRKGGKFYLPEGPAINSGQNGVAASKRKKKRVMSPEARAAISAGQKKRWLIANQNK